MERQDIEALEEKQRSEYDARFVKGEEDNKRREQADREQRAAADKQAAAAVKNMADAQAQEDADNERASYNFRQQINNDDQARFDEDRDRQIEMEEIVKFRDAKDYKEKEMEGFLKWKESERLREEAEAKAKEPVLAKKAERDAEEAYAWDAHKRQQQEQVEKIASEEAQRRRALAEKEETLKAHNSRSRAQKDAEAHTARKVEEAANRRAWAAAVSTAQTKAKEDAAFDARLNNKGAEAEEDRPRQHTKSPEYQQYSEEPAEVDEEMAAWEEAQRQRAKKIEEQAAQGK